MGKLEDVEIVSLSSYIFKDNLNDFDCGEEKLNDFLKNEAFKYENSFKTCTQLVVSKNNGNIIGFYTCTTTNLELTYSNDKELYKSFTSDLDDDISMKTTEPVYYLTDLAIDREYQNKGYGTGMLNEIFKDFITAYIYNHICMAGILLYSLDEAREFYKNRSFKFLHGYEKAERIEVYPMFISTNKIAEVKGKGLTD